MKDRFPTGCRPFENLKVLLDARNLRFPERFEPPPENTGPASEDPIPQAPIPESEDELFAKAMADVKPLSGKNRIEPDKPPLDPDPPPDADEEAIERLQKLIQSGEGFVIAHTAEYMEGGDERIHPDLARRLHRGDFSVQDHIDLHGFTVSEAREAIEAFLKESVLTGKRAVLIVHGRGLSSPQKPVLKTKVYEWLTSGPWRKWVIAFTSARSCDGGAGATYVLLRSRPAAKRRKPPST
jgi:DNA-nicking Smr family endonuclease